MNYLKRGRVTAQDTADSFEVAKQLVEAAVEAGTADSAEVLGSDGTVMYRRPRVVRKG